MNKAKEERIEVTFWKFVTFIDLCKNNIKNRYTVNEVLSIFMSNFTGDEIIEFRNYQRKNR